MAKLMEAHPVQYMLKECPDADPSQYGCQKGASTTHALLRILQPVYYATDNSANFARWLLVDFSKAFDHIHHPILISKLQANGVDPILVNWFAAFLHNRQQRVKLKGETSQWHQTNGGVPQGSLSGPQLFIHHVSDLHTDAPDVKYMDDTTLSEISRKSRGSNLQVSADQVSQWSKDNELGINCTKTKDMVVAFERPPNDFKAQLPPLVINGCDIERVSESKLLGVIIQDNLKWDSHVHYMNSKASKRLYYLRWLKRSGVPKTQLKDTFLAIIRSVLEYACPVWSTSLNKELSKVLESIQMRACKIIVPKLSYEDAIIDLELPLLYDRRMDICKDFFKSMCDPNHKLHDMLPLERPNLKGLRNWKPREPPLLKTERAKNSFVPYCLNNFQ